MRKGIMFAAAGLGVGLVVGYWGRGYLSATPPPVAPAAQSVRAPHPVPIAEPPSRPSGPEEANKLASLPPNAKWIGGDTLGLLRMLEMMGRQGLLAFHVQAFDPNSGHISAALKALFQIKDDEEVRINAAIDAAKQQREQMELSLASGRRDEKSGALIISLPTYPEQGGKIYDALLTQFRQTLGSERGALFDSVCGGDFERCYGQVGLEPHTYTITKAASGQGAPLITVRDDTKSVVGLGPDGRTTFNSSGWSESRYLSRAEVVKRLGAMGEKLVPPDL